VIFRTKYPKHFRASFRLPQFCKCTPPPYLEILDLPLKAAHLEEKQQISIFYSGFEENLGMNA
jgi:hypothetical protein